MRALREAMSIRAQLTPTQIMDLVAMITTMIMDTGDTRKKFITIIITTLIVPKCTTLDPKQPILIMGDHHRIILKEQ